MDDSISLLFQILRVGHFFPQETSWQAKHMTERPFASAVGPRVGMSGKVTIALAAF